MTTLQICPPHLSDVATLPWEIQKVIGTRCMSLHGVDVKTLVIIINKAFENVKNVGGKRPDLPHECGLLSELVKHG